MLQSVDWRFLLYVSGQHVTSLIPADMTEQLQCEQEQHSP